MSRPQSDDQVTQAWRQHRPYLVNLASQMLGGVGEAEDVAQEAFLRLSRADITAIDDVRAWLTVVAGRLCLDRVRSARSRYERPEDIGTEVAAVNQSGRVDPADRVTLDDEVRTALWEVLRRLSPGERVSFVLHDVFGVPFDAIAETVGRPVGTCRQLARRARTKFALGQPKPGEVSTTEHQLVAEQFITACANGDLQALATVLAAPAPPPQINHGPHNVAVNLLRYLGPGATVVSGPAGQPVLLAFAERRLFAVIVLTIRDHRVTKIEATADPSARA